MGTVLITPDNFMGHYTKLIVEFYKEDVTTVHPDKFTFHSIDEYILPDTLEIIIAGYPYYNTLEAGFREVLESVDFGEDIPFTSVLHANHYGQPIQRIKGVTSLVEEDIAYPVGLWKHLKEQGYREDTKALTELIEYIGQYHAYNFNLHKHSIPLHLKLMSTTYGDAVADLIPMNEDRLDLSYGHTNYLHTVYANYLKKQVRSADTFVTKNKTVVCIVYVDRYENEVAHNLIKLFEGKGYSRVLVLVGSHTRGSDIFQVRVSKDLNAGEIAEDLGKGSGNEHAGVVFLSKTRETLVEGLKEYLRDRL